MCYYVVCKMMSYYLSVGDLLITENRVGVVTKIRTKSIQYYTCTNGPGAFFNENKDNVYHHIDKGACTHHPGKTKYRKRRSKKYDC